MDEDLLMRSADPCDSQAVHAHYRRVRGSYPSDRQRLGNGVPQEAGRFTGTGCAYFGFLLMGLGWQGCRKLLDKLRLKESA